MRAVILALLAGAASAQERTEDCTHVEAMPGASVIQLATHMEASDVLAMAPLGTSVTLCYLNHAAKVSSNETRTIEAGGVQVRVQITVGTDSERVTITPPPGWMVFPADYADAPVSDGSALTVAIISGIM